MFWKSLDYAPEPPSFLCSLVRGRIPVSSKDAEPEAYRRHYAGREPKNTGGRPLLTGSTKVRRFGINGWMARRPGSYELIPGVARKAGACVTNATR